MRAFILWLFWWCMPRRRSAGNDVPQCGPAFFPTCQINNEPVPHGGACSKKHVSTPSASAPQCGAKPAVGVPFLAHVNPHCGIVQLARAQLALTSLSEGWWRAAQQKGSLRHCGPQEVAHELWRCMRTQEALMGFRIPSRWIEDRYPIFCKAGHFAKALPFKDFARELKRIMPKGRPESWRDGRRRAITTYKVVPFREAVCQFQAVREAA